MDKDKQIQKVDKLSLKKLSENSSLAKRGLRDIGIWPKIQVLLKEIEKQFLLIIIKNALIFAMRR